MKNPNPDAQNSSLEEQFFDREHIDINGEAFEVIDIQPEEIKSQTPVFLAPGWAPHPNILKENALTIAQSGRRVIMINAPHGAKAEPTQQFSEPEERKSEALIQVLQKKGIEKVDVVGHSEAGLYATAAVLRRPELFRNIVLVDTVGMIGKDRIEYLTGRFITDIAEQTKQAIGCLFQDPERFKRTAKAMYYASKPLASGLVRSVKEVHAISQSQIEDRLRELKNMGKGVVMIHAVDDKAFPMERVQKQSSLEFLDGFYSVRGTHNEFFLDPENQTKVVNHALDALEKKYET